MLIEIGQLILGATPRTILVDFEQAAIASFQQSYPNAQVSGCYFHLSQSVLRKVNELGLKTLYENDIAVRNFIRCIPALAFVQEADVIEAFDLLAESKPLTDNDEASTQLETLLTFFEHTYVRGRRLRGRGENYTPPLFALKLWNKHEAGADGISRTTNVAEGWHHGLQALFQGHHPTMWKFLRGLVSDMSKQKTSYLHGVAGLVLPCAKRYGILNDRVMNAVANYGNSEILVYLRSIAHLSYQ